MGEPAIAGHSSSVLSGRHFGYHLVHLQQHLDRACDGRFQLPASRHAPPIRESLDCHFEPIIVAETNGQEHRLPYPLGGLLLAL